MYATLYSTVHHNIVISIDPRPVLIKDGIKFYKIHKHIPGNNIEKSTNGEFVANVNFVAIDENKIGYFCDPKDVRLDYPIGPCEIA